MKVIGIIPARLGSTRLNKKPLRDLAGKALIARVYENAATFGLDDLVVATDSTQIVDIVEAIGGKAMLTPSELPSGTYRCAHLAKEMDADVVINIQGDEPFLLEQQVKDLIAAFNNEETQIATLCYPLLKSEYLENPSIVKVVKDAQSNALYFSRSAIPFVRGHDINNWINQHSFYKHIGVYAFRRSVLLKIAAYKQGALEQAESLEQLTWLENGHKIKMVETPNECMSIDTEQDLERAIALYNQR